MIAITFTINLIQPLLASALEGDPNSGTSFPYVPGSVIRGTIIDQYLAHQPAVDLADDTDARRYFFSGQTRYLNAYLLDNTQKANRTLPTPLSWIKDKNSADNYSVVDKAHPDFVSPDSLAQFEQPKPVESAFYSSAEAGVTTYKPLKSIKVHNQRDRRAGRATDAAGAIFRYEALATGQRFGGVILCESAADADVIESLLAEVTHMGGSRQAGYGQVEILDIQRPDPWQEAATQAVGAGATLTVTLLSDLIVRDEQGQYTDVLPAPVLATAVGLPPETIRLRQAFKRAALVAGFNRKWGLPLPQTPAIQAGSVFIFVTDQALAQNDLATLVANGLGERRAEGFGRIAVNGWVYTQPQFQLATTEEQERPKTELLQLSKESLRLARLMTRRHRQRTLERQLAQAINEIQLRKPPKKSQLGGLRVVLRTALAEQKTTTALDYLKKMRPAGRRQFEQARMVRARQNLYDWLEAQLETPSGVWELLSYQPSDHNPLKLDQTTVDDTDEQLAVTYTLRLLDGVLAKATKLAGGN